MGPQMKMPVHRSRPLYRILSHFNPVLTLTSYSSGMRFNIILQTTSVLFSSVFPNKNLYALLIFTLHATCPAHLMLQDLITLTILGED
jgi:hypothetical protein